MERAAEQPTRIAKVGGGGGGGGSPAEQDGRRRRVWEIGVGAAADPSGYYPTEPQAVAGLLVRSLAKRRAEGMTGESGRRRGE